MNGRPALPTAANLKFAHRVAGEIEPSHADRFLVKTQPRPTAGESTM